LTEACEKLAPAFAKTGEGRAAEVERLIAPAIVAMGYDVVRVLLSGKRRPRLQIMAERHDGAGMVVKDCVALSRAIEAILDAEDPIVEAYELEVSSPGIDRPLTRLDDFERFAGFEVKLELRTPIDGRDHRSEGADEHLRGFIGAFLDAHANEVDATCEHAIRTNGESEHERIRQLYEREKASVRRFLEPGEEEGGLDRARVRTAMIFIETYRDLPLLAWPREVLDSLVAFEQSFLIFRQRHARMVERVIGRRVGTGGSDGVDYLDRTALEYRVFKEVWAARTLLLQPALAPEVENPDFYALRNP